jgi:hypothetical protein
MNTALESAEIRPLVKGPRGPVPYITTWSQEAGLPTQLIATPVGVAYADELCIDRDEHGVLWPRVPSRPGLGEPLYAVVHPLRLRRAMRRLLCQVCASPADHTDAGTLWILPEDGTFDWSEWPKRVLTTHAPVCVRCARISVKVCPAVKRGHQVVRAHSTVIGISGEQYEPDFPFPRLVGENVLAKFGEPVIRWVKANYLVRELHDCKLVTL